MLLVFRRIYLVNLRQITYHANKRLFSLFDRGLWAYIRRRRGEWTLYCGKIVSATKRILRSLKLSLLSPPRKFENQVSTRLSENLWCIIWCKEHVRHSDWNRSICFRALECLSEAEKWEILESIIQFFSITETQRNIWLTKLPRQLRNPKQVTIATQGVMGRFGFNVVYLLCKANSSTTNRW